MSLENLRDELGRVDREILGLVARRQELAVEIGEEKARSGIPIRDYGQEKIVVERVVQGAGEMGLDPELARNLALTLIDASLTAQEKRRVTGRAQGTGKRVLVIGGAGKMGGWMSRFLASQGYQVEIADPVEQNGEFPCVPDWTASPLDHDIIVVATPLGISRQILGDLVDRKPAGLVFDIGSLKSPLREPLENLARAGVRVASVHPMFGPDTELLSGRHVIFVDLGVPPAMQDAKALFESTMVIPVEMALDLHDKVIAYVLGLSHAVNIAFLSALNKSGEAAGQLAEVSSTTFDAQLAVSSAVARDNPRLYFEIQSLNDFGPQALDALVDSVSHVRQVVRDGDEAAFIDLMGRGARYFEGHRIQKAR